MLRREMLGVILIGLCAALAPARAHAGAAGPGAGRLLRLEDSGWAPWRSAAAASTREEWGAAGAAADADEVRDARGEAQTGPRTSRLRAIGASLLLPGLGQMAHGHSGRARAFLTAEAAIWTGFIVSEIEGRVRKDRYVDYAETFAGVPEADGRPDWFYRNLGNYADFETYRDDIARSARAIYGDDLAAREAYVAENLRGVPAWEWESQDRRREFREQRKASRNAYRRAGLFVGAALLNRLVSALDAAWLSGRNRSAEHADARTIFYQPDEKGGYLCVRWTPGR